MSGAAHPISPFELRIVRPGAHPTVVRIEAPVTILGRDEGDVVLGDPKTSRRHVELRVGPAGLQLRDLGSTNGTWIQGRRVERCRLRPGDRFQVGETVVEVLAVGGPQAQGGEKKRTVMAYGSPGPSGSGQALPPPEGPATWRTPDIPSPSPFPAPSSGSPGAVAGSFGPHAAEGPPPGPVPTASPGAGAEPPAASSRLSREDADDAPTRTARRGGTSGTLPSTWEIRTRLRPADLLPVTIGGSLLVLLTAGIYAPWFVVSLLRRFLAHTEIRADSTTYRMEFIGTGSDLFVRTFFGGLFSALTLGLYVPRLAADLLDYFAGSLLVRGPGRGRIRVVVKVKGADLAPTVLPRFYLTVFTCGLTWPWLLFATVSAAASTCTIRRGRHRLATVTFDGRPGALFLAMVTDILLLVPTLGLSFFDIALATRRRLVEGIRVHTQAGQVRATLEVPRVSWALLHGLCFLLAPGTLFGSLAFLLAVRWRKLTGHLRVRSCPN